MGIRLVVGLLLIVEALLVNSLSGVLPASWARAWPLHVALLLILAMLIAAVDGRPQKNCTEVPEYLSR